MIAPVKNATGHTCFTLLFNDQAIRMTKTTSAVPDNRKTRLITALCNIAAKRMVRIPIMISMTYCSGSKGNMSTGAKFMMTKTALSFEKSTAGDTTAV